MRAVKARVLETGKRAMSVYWNIFLERHSSCETIPCDFPQLRLRRAPWFGYRKHFSCFLYSHVFAPRKNTFVYCLESGNFFCCCCCEVFKGTPRGGLTGKVILRQGVTRYTFLRTASQFVLLSNLYLNRILQPQGNLFRGRWSLTTFQAPDE